VKNKSEKRFQLLLTEEEFQVLKVESEKREISASELIRRSLDAEIHQKSDLERINAFKRLISYNK